MNARPAADELSRAELRRYGRHLVIPEVGEAGQRKLKAARVLLVGSGGLGSPLALYLAAAGVGHLGLVEFDTVDESNLQRQVLFGQSDLGQPKIEAAARRLADVNPHVELQLHPVRLGVDNALDLLRDYDVIADGSDNFPTRYLVNDACVLLGKPEVYGSIFRFEGQVSVFWGARGPCYRCLFPEPPPPGLVPSCAEGGVLGVLPGIIGSLQANEVIKLILGIGEPLIGRFVLFDALAMRFREISLSKSPDCPVCSADPSQKGLVAYDDSCAVPVVETRDADPVGEDLPWEIEVSTLVAWLAEERAVTLVDVREPVERSIASLPGAVPLPLAELQQRLDEIDRESSVVVYCHTGIRSLYAVELLRREGFSNAASLRGGIDAWSRNVDPSLPRY